MYNYLKDELSKVASKHGERLLDTKNNPISMGKNIIHQCTKTSRCGKLYKVPVNNFSLLFQV